MKRLVLALLIIILTLASCQSEMIYKNADTPVNQRVDDLIGRMTLPEKIGQLCCPIGFGYYEKSDDSTVTFTKAFQQLMDTMPQGAFWAVLRADPWSQKTLETGLNPYLSAKLLNQMQRYAVEKTRLGIPILFAEECPHGHMAIGTTVFPTGIAQASTWNKNLLEKMGEAIGKESSCQGARVGYGPVLDIARDPRWSRVEEGFGEDPFLSGMLGCAVQKGMSTHLCPTLKHLAAYGLPQGGHNGNTASVGRRQLITDYMANFEMAVKSGAKSVMTSYNAIDGIPCTANQWLLRDVLRKSWGFDGVVFSDLGSIWALHTNHRVAENHSEAAAMALNAGVDIDLGGSNYGVYLADAMQNGFVDEAKLDEAVRHVLKLKFEMGLFENPYVDETEAMTVVRSKENVSLAKEVAREGVVLLKNDGILPLNKDLKKIAVIGPNADNIYNQIGDYSSPQKPDDVVTVLEGVRNMASGSSEVTYLKACDIRDVANTNITQAVSLAKASDVVILVVGGSSARDFKTTYAETGAAVANALISDMENGEGFDRCTLNLLGDQEALIQALATTQTPLVIVYIEGRPLLKNLASEQANALLTAWYPGQEGGNAIAEVLFGDYNPSGRLPISVPKSVGQLPVYYSQNEQNAYVEGDSKPLYSFGYGLSYSAFEYSNLTIEKIGSASVGFDETNPLFKVACVVTNVGRYDGAEVVQLYVKDDFASIAPPRKLLKGFEKIYLKRSETREVSFILTERDFAVLDSQLNWTVESGSFTIEIGASSEDVRLEGKMLL